MKYIEVVKDIKICLNNRSKNRHKEIYKNFRDSIKILRDDFKIQVSTKFLRNLLNSDLTTQQKTIRLKNVLRKSGLKTEKKVRSWRGFIYQSYKTDLIEYGFKPLSKVNKFELTEGEQQQLKRLRNYELTEEEKQQIAEIKEIEGKTGIALFQKALKENLEKNKKRRAIYGNKDLVVIKNIERHGVSKEFIGNISEVLHFIGV